MAHPTHTHARPVPGRTVARAAVRVAACMTTAALLAGCASKPVLGPFVPANPSINPGYEAGAVLGLPSGDGLRTALSRVPHPDSVEADPRARAMRESAVAYGARAGLADAAVAINARLQSSASELSRTYDFGRVLIEGPDDVRILPPVISQAVDTWDVADAGKAVRTADAYYEIVRQARFVSAPPAWQAYLLRTYEVPEPPARALLPDNRKERDRWEGWVAEGFAKGREQANLIFKEDLARLERDFTGMVRYKKLLDQGMVSAPTVSDERLGTTGTGEDMRVNDRSVRIDRTPKLRVDDASAWTASPTTPGPDGPVGAGSKAPGPKAPGAKGAAGPKKTPAPVTVAATDPTPPAATVDRPPSDRAAW